MGKVPQQQIYLMAIIMVCLIGLGASARMNVEDIDYDSLISLLSDDYEQGGVGEMEPMINNVYDERNIPKYTQQRPNIEHDEEKIGSVDISKPSFGNFLAPQVEVLNLIEAFLKLKGELASRVNAVIIDNVDLFKTLYSVIMSKVSKLHSFTLIGISCIRKILEFAVKIIAGWQVNVPTVSFGFN